MHKVNMVDVNIYWAIPLSIISKSASYSGNYFLSAVYVEKKDGGKNDSSFWKLVKVYIKSRFKIYFWVSIWKIILIFLFTIALSSLYIEPGELFNFNSGEKR